MRLFWGQLHPQILINALTTHSKLSRHGHYVNLFGSKIMDLLITCDAFLMKLLAFGFQIRPHTGLPGVLLLCFFCSRVPGWRVSQGFKLRLFVEEEAFHGF